MEGQGLGHPVAEPVTEIMGAEVSLPRSLTPTNLRAVTPLFYAHVNRYGMFDPYMDTRLLLEPSP